MSKETLTQMPTDPTTAGASSTEGTGKTQDADAGAVTPTTPKEEAKVDPKVQAALDTLKAAGLMGKDIFTSADMKYTREAMEAKAAQDKQKAADAAKDQALKEQGEFKTLAERLEPENQALKERLARYEKDADQRITDAVASWPTLAKEGDPGPGAENRQAWYDATHKLAAALREQTVQQNQVQGGTGKTPTAKGSTDQGDLVDAFMGQKYGAKPVDAQAK